MTRATYPVVRVGQLRHIRLDVSLHSVQCTYSSPARKPSSCPLLADRNAGKLVLHNRAPSFTCCKHISCWNATYNYACKQSPRQECHHLHPIITLLCNHLHPIRAIGPFPDGPCPCCDPPPPTPAHPSPLPPPPSATPPIPCPLPHLLRCLHRRVGVGAQPGEEALPPRMAQQALPTLTEAVLPRQVTEQLHRVSLRAVNCGMSMLACQ